MKVYYNEIEPNAIIWLQAAMDAGYIANGDIDTRSIEDVTPNDLMGYDRCHFFAGIGGWELALQLADYEQQGVLWTGSCPCQSFSTAGKGAGFDDPRHLWPAWFWLIQQCKPDTIYGEQVAAAIGKGWLDLVANDLESEGYATAAAVLPACSVGAPHKRERLWFVANSAGKGLEGRTRESLQGGGAGLTSGSTLGNAQHDGQFAAAKLRGNEAPSNEWWEKRKNFSGQFERASAAIDVSGIPRGTSGKWESAAHHVANAQCERQSGQGKLQQSISAAPNRIRKTDWSDYFSEVEWIDCPDGKSRPVKYGICLLVDGIPAKLRKAALHGFGNAIVPQVAAEFIMATR